MDSFFFSIDGSASAWTSVRLYDLGFTGVVRFLTDVGHGGAIEHQCIRFRDTRGEALIDAKSDAQKLVRMWAEGRVLLGHPGPDED